MYMKSKTQSDCGDMQDGSVCMVCGNTLSAIHAGIASHMRKHVRDGSVRELRNKDAKLVWVSTGKDPLVVDSRIIKPIGGAYKKNTPPRNVKYAKSTKNGNVSIKCFICNKYNGAMIKKGVVNTFADDRFISITCCDTVSLYPSRLIDKLVSNYGEEFRD